MVYEKINPISKVLKDEENASENPIPKSYLEHPFQVFLDRAADAISNVSAVENHAVTMVDKYVAGQASLEDVMFAQNAASLQINIASTALNNIVTAFREVQSMQV
jgi:flagellar hook-basal body complex protein FliE